MTNRPTSKPHTAWTGFLHSRRTAIAAGTLAILILTWWLAPRPVQRLIPVDGSANWSEQTAPPRTEVVWLPAREIPGLLPDLEAGLVSPAIDNHGLLLLFSRRIEDRQNDIYLSRFLEGTWSPAEPVTGLNSGANELGPVLSRDGTQLYFYSDRPGGFGGTDLYVATRTAGGPWSTPRNLGSKINSSANEYDPAIAPDGLTLYFASNRTGELARQIAEDQPARTNGSDTLGAPGDQPLFDLYRARRERSDAEWGPSQPLDQLNRADSTEGAPFVSPNGAFLYFATDRAARPGERRNLDLYRARVSGEQVLPPENLGPGINTAAHETEPSLAAEGFTLVFSSNRDGVDGLYASTATEVYREQSWDASRWQALQSSWIPLSLLLTLAALLAAGLYYREWLFRQVWGARFFLGSVLLNLAALALLAVWKLPEVVEVIVNQVVSAPSAEVVEENTHQSHEEGRQAYEKVADLKSLDPAPLPEIARLETTPLSLPERTERLVPTIPLEQARALPPERVLMIPPKPVAPPEGPQDLPPFELPRQRPRQPVAAPELPTEGPQELTAGLTPAEQTEPVAPLELARGQSIPGANEMPQPPRPTPLQQMQPAALPIARAEPLENTLPLSRPEARLLPRVRPTGPADAAPVTEMQELELAARHAPAEETIPVPQAPQLTRTEARLNTPAEPLKPLAMPAPGNPLVHPIKPQFTPDNLLTEDADSLAAPGTLARSRPELKLTETTPAEAAELAGVKPPAEVAIASTPVEMARPTQLPLAGPAPPPAELASPATRLNHRAAVRQLNEARQELPPAFSPLAARLQPQLARASRKSAAVTQAELPDPELASQITPAEEALIAPPAPLISRMQVPLNNPAESARPVKPVPALPPENPLARQIRRQTTPDALLTEEAVTVPAPQTLARSRSEMNATDVTTPAEAAELAGVELPDEVAMAAAPVELIRSSGVPLAAPVPTPRELTGPVTHLKHLVSVGELSETRNQAPPAFSPLESRLDRKLARATRVAFAEDNVGLKDLFTFRQGDTRRQHIEVLGGSEQSEKAVNLGLEWLARNQEPDGSWDLRKHGGGENSRCAGTGLGLLPFLAAGHTHHQPGPYQQQVAAALRWLREKQQANGCLLGPGDGQAMYSHGIAAIALCEAYGMSRDESLKEPAQRALEFIVSAQHPGSGGWRYNPGESADTSVVGWQVMALKSGEMAGLTVAPAVYDQVQRWLQSVEGKAGASGTFGYVNRSVSPAMTAEGLLNLQFLGTDRNSPRMRTGADYLLNHLPRRDQQLTSYYWYYGTQVMYHMQGSYWKTWNESLRDLLVETQIQSGEHAGTWNPADHWEQRGGRVYATSLKLLMLEIYYRHLPLYEQLEE